MERRHWEEISSPNFSAQDFFSQANQSESLMFEKLDWEGEKRVKTSKQASKQTKNHLCSAAITKILEEKDFKRKRRGSQIPCWSIWTWVRRCKDKHFKGGRSRDSACCGAGDLDVGAEESSQGTEGHCAWNAKASAAPRREMPGSRRRSPGAARGTAGRGSRDGRRERGAHCGHPLPAPRFQSERARSGKGLETEGLKEGLREKAANFRGWTEELLQARKAALSKQRAEIWTVRPSRVKPAARSRVCTERWECSTARENRERLSSC